MLRVILLHTKRQSGYDKKLTRWFTRSLRFYSLHKYHICGERRKKHVLQLNFSHASYFCFWERLNKNHRKNRFNCCEEKLWAQFQSHFLFPVYFQERRNPRWHKVCNLNEKCNLIDHDRMRLHMRSYPIATWWRLGSQGMFSFSGLCHRYAVKS